MRTAFALIVLLLVVLAGSLTANAATIHGKAKVVNGDTIIVGGKRIGLYGIDAPKDSYRCIIKNKRARCGNGAGPALARLIDRRRVTCDTRGRDKKRRYRKALLLAVCHAGNDNLGEWMLRVGWAEAVERGEPNSGSMPRARQPDATAPSVRFKQPPASQRIPVAARSQPSSHGPVGSARVIDGDTLEIGDLRVRLFGIDAPESKQTCGAKSETWRCGQSASIALMKLIGTEGVHCHERDVDRYGRIVAVCKLRDDGGEDINAAMVRDGWAMAYRRFSTEYVGLERKARKDKKGIWRGEFTAPWEWRQSQWEKTPNRPTLLSKQGSQSCVIKGNISSKGERIYHVRGGRYYGKTKISQSKGERWFCSEAAARAAGWRRSKR